MAEFFDRKEDYAYIRWAKEVKIRDHFACDICGRRGVALHAHHLNAWASYPDQRYDLDNGTSLCLYHHQDFHDRFGKGQNTAAQYKEYREIARALVKAASTNSANESAARKMLQVAERERVVREIIADLDNRYGRKKDGYGSLDKVTE